MLNYNWKAHKIHTRTLLEHPEQVCHWITQDTYYIRILGHDWET